MIFLDSTFLIKLVRKNSHALDLLKSLEEYILITSVINVYEIWLGFYKNERIRNEFEYKTIIERRINSILNNIQILNLNESTAKSSAEIGGELISQGKDIGDKDSIIGGIMKSKEIKHIITSNVKHFRRMKEIITLNENDPVDYNLSKIYYSKGRQKKEK